MSNTQTDIDYFLQQNDINLQVKIIDNNNIYIFLMKILTAFIKFL